MEKKTIILTQKPKKTITLTPKQKYIEEQMKSRSLPIKRAKYA